MRPRRRRLTGAAPCGIAAVYPKVIQIAALALTDEIGCVLALVAVALHWQAGGRRRAAARA